MIYDKELLAETCRLELMSIPYRLLGNLSRQLENARIRVHSGI